MKEITVKELKAKLDAKEDFQLIDVREGYEYETGNINGLHIPMGDVMAHADQIAKDKMVVVHCKSGARSAAIVNALETQLGYTNLYNLKGGIKAWSEEIDPTIHY
jgi:rhodanese-related sulfurtransferase